MKVLGPPGVVIAISGWMIDPVVCSGMTRGTPRVDLAALIELHRLVTGGDKSALFRGGRRITQEDHDEIPQSARAGVGCQSARNVDPLSASNLHPLIDDQRLACPALSGVAEGRPSAGAVVLRL